MAVVDPGAPEPADQAPLLALLDALAAEGRPAREVWLTHVHPDHVGAAAVVADRHGVRVRAHALARGRVPGVEVAPLREGDLAGGRFRVLETPGHAREHLAFLDEESGALVCGDLVSTLSTIVIDPPEGDMAEYERQLERMRMLAPRTLFPAHGPPAPDAGARLARVPRAPARARGARRRRAPLRWDARGAHRARVRGRPPAGAPDRRAELPRRAREARRPRAGPRARRAVRGERVSGAVCPRGHGFPSATSGKPHPAGLAAR